MPSWIDSAHSFFQPKDPASIQSWMVGVQALSAFANYHVDLASRTNLGGVLTLLACILSFFFIQNQLDKLLDPSTKTSITFDQVLEDDLLMRLNISLNAIPCRLVDLSIIDQIGNVNRAIPGVRRFNVHKNKQGRTTKKELWHPPAWPVAHATPLERLDHISQNDLEQLHSVKELASFAQDLVIVFYYAQGVPLSKRMMVELKKLQTILGENGMDKHVIIRFVNCTFVSNLQARQNADGHTENDANDPMINVLGLPAVLTHRAKLPLPSAHALSKLPGIKEVGGNVRDCVDDKVFAFPSALFRLNGRSFEYVGPAIAAALYQAAKNLLLSTSGPAKDVVVTHEKNFTHFVTEHMQMVAKELRAFITPSLLKDEATKSTGDELSALRELVRLNFSASFLPDLQIVATFGNTPEHVRSYKRASTMVLLNEQSQYFESCDVEITLKVNRVPTTVRIEPFIEGGEISHFRVNMSHTVNGLNFVEPEVMKLRGLNETLESSGAAPTSTSRTLLQRIEKRRSARLHQTISRTALEERVATDPEIGLNLEPLAGAEYLAKVPLTDFDHFLKVVPASFAYNDGNTGSLYLYSANNRASQHLSAMTPRIVFAIDVSPLRLKVTENHTPLTEILTSTVAFLGGLFSLLGLIDAMYYRTVAKWFPKKLV